MDWWNWCKRARARWKRLAGSERALLVGAAILLPVNILALRLLGFRWWVTLLGGVAPRPVSLSADAARITVDRTTRMVLLAAVRGPCRATCLPRSLTLWWLLRLARVPAKLMIGVRTNEGKLDAHAWVEVAGRPLNESHDVRRQYAAFERDVSLRGAA